jgi:hypothetical protein
MSAHPTRMNLDTTEIAKFNYACEVHAIAEKCVVLPSRKGGWGGGDIS